MARVAPWSSPGGAGEPGSRPLPSCAPVAAGLYCLKYQIPAMTESAGGGSIINNASIGGVRGIPELAP